MDMKLEVVAVPVSDVDRAKRFYESLGFHVDIDFVPNNDFRGRVVQLTPPGSDASIQVGKGLTSALPGSLQNTYLVVSDIEAARADLVGRGVKVSEVFHRGPEGRVAGRAPESSNYRSFASFTDPDGNTWLLQEITKRLPGRTASQLLYAEVTDLLLSALKSAAAAHGVHEKELGRSDPDWPQWYAEHMTRTLGGAGYHITGPSAVTS
jgi:catechol 2,3-dioxygenase-like lactoylglutathione lyase family enzyme